MAFCPECGKSVGAGAAQCPYCQRELSAGKSAPPAGQPVRLAPNAEPTAPSPAKRTMLGTGVQAPGPSPAAAAAAMAVAATPVAPSGPEPRERKIASADATLVGQPGFIRHEAMATTGAAPGEQPASSTSMGQEELAAATELAREPHAAAAAALEASADDVARADTQPPDRLEEPQRPRPVHDASRTARDDADAREHIPLIAAEGRAATQLAGFAQPIAAGPAPRLRFDEPQERQPRRDALAEPKWLWIGAAAIAVACLALMIVLAVKLSR